MVHRAAHLWATASHQNTASRAVGWQVSKAREARPEHLIDKERGDYSQSSFLYTNDRGVTTIHHLAEIISTTTSVQPAHIPHKDVVVLCIH